MEENDKNPEIKSKSSLGKRILKTIGKIVLGLLIFLFLLVLFIRSPWGQGIIVDKAVSYITDKTNTTVEIDKLFITFDGDLQLDGVYLEDQSGDTLVYSRSLEANVPLWAIIRGDGLGIDDLEWSGVRANIKRQDSISGFNFQFLTEAFASTDTTTTATDTTSVAPLELIIGTIDLKEFDIVFNDAVSGIDSRYIFDELTLDMNAVNLDSMRFAANKLDLTNARITIKQSSVPDTPDEEATLLPFLSAEEVNFKNVFFQFDSTPEELILEFDVKDLYTELDKIDLTNSAFDIGRFELSKSIILIHTEAYSTNTNNTIEKAPDSTNTEGSAFTWPEIDLRVSGIQLSEDKFSFFIGNQSVKKSVFNPNAIVLSNLNLSGSNLQIGNQEATAIIDSASFREGSGFDVNQFAISLELNEKELNADDIELSVNGNKLVGRLNMDYPSLNSMIAAPETANIDFNFPSFRFDLSEVFKFQPNLENNPYLKTLAERQITGSLAASGVLSDIKIPKANVQWGRTTSLSASGTIKNATIPDSLRFDLPAFNAITTRSDLNKFIAQDSLSINLPQEINLSGSLAGSITSIDTDAVLTTSQGLARLNGSFEYGDRIAFDGELTIEDYQMNQLLNNDQIGNLSVNLTATGQGKSINNLDAEIDATISNFRYNNYTVNNLNITGNFKDGVGNVYSKYKDENINIALEGSVELDSVDTSATIELDVIGADLQGLGLMQRQIKTGMKVYAQFTGNFSDYDVSAIVDDGVVVYDNQTYLLGDLSLLAHIRTDTTSVSIKNKVLDLNLQSNAEPQRFSKALQKHIYSYFYRDVVLSDTLSDPINVKVEGHFAKAPIVSEVFLVNLKDLDTIDINIDFDQKSQHLDAQITAPRINYSDVVIDSLKFTMSTDKELFDFNLNFKEINAGPLSIHKTVIEGNQSDNILDLSFNAYYNKDGEEKQLIHVLHKISGSRDDLSLHIVPDSLIFNSQKWKIPEDNQVRYVNNELIFNNVIFEHSEQFVELVNDKPNYDINHLAASFKNFKLDNFLNYLNPNNELAEGVINGEIVFEKPLTDTGLQADFSVDNFSVLDVDLGTMNVNGNALGKGIYTFNLNMKGGKVDLDLLGDYESKNNQAFLDLNLNINEVQMSALNGLSLGYLEDGSGTFNGNFKLNGTLAEPSYNGNLNFNNSEFKVSALNTIFTLVNESMSIDNDGIKMSNFKILDESNNAMIVSGSIGTETLMNPSFDLSISAKRFQALNATAEDNDMVYGKLLFDADATIKGDLQIPVVDGSATVLPETNLNYILPSATVNIEKRDGLVVFVNKENPDAILTQTEERTATFKGFDISTVLKVNKEAVFTIILNKNTGDNFQVTGEGELNFDIQPNGRMTLNGVYNINDGHYEMSLYNLVNRRFKLAEGGKVRWSGNPFDAELDVQAIYDIKTSASALMAPRISGADPSIKNKYKQVLPFYVYLNIDGQLTAPEISFDLDMPEEEQGAIGGQVYGRVQEVNSQEGELNRQVFSLLVLNKFYPEPGSDGSEGGFASVARDNLNDALSDQLNVFSDKLLGNTGVELDFSLDSFTDYQGDSPQDRTQLDIAAQKKLFDDRLIVRVGSEVDVQGSNTTGEATPLIGNVSIEYVLTPDGRYRLKGFRRDEFENVIDGQTIVSGIALIFTQEFNQFSELWDAMFKSQTEQEKNNEEEIKKAKEQLEKKDETDDLKPKN